MTQEFENCIFSVPRIAFLEVLRGMQCILEKKDQDSAPIRMLLSQSGELLLTISDGAIFMESSIEVELEEFKPDLKEMYLPVSTVYDLVRRLEVDKIKFLVSEKMITLQYGEGDFSLTKIVSMTNYMRDSQMEALVFSIHSAALLETLRMLKTTMASEDIRDQFKGISVIVENDQMTLWSTDGIKMCIAKLNIDIDMSLKAEGIWPRKFIETLLALNNDVMIELQMSNRHVRSKIGKTIILSPLVNAKLLDHRSIIDESAQPTIKITTEASYLQKKLDRMMILTDSDGSVLFDMENLTISCSNKQKSDRAFEKIEIMHEGSPEKFFVNPYIIASFLRNFKTTIEILFFAKSKVLVVRKKDEKYPLYITKSMTIKSN